MKYLLRNLAFVLIFGSAHAQSKLPFCSGDDFAKWNNCFGTWKTPYSKYEGEFSDGQRHGKGTLTYPNGDTYIGEFKNGKLNGQVSYSNKTGDKYVGQYKDDMRSGRGEAIYLNGSKYSGEFKENKFEGQGMVNYANGDKYLGEFKNNKSHGKGTLSFANGNVYVGDFKDGLLSGQGTLSYANGEKYEGRFLEGTSNGYGTYTYPTGDRYVGEHKNGKTNGQGTVTYKNGNKFVGEFKDDNFHGKGTFSFANGDVYVGNFKEGVRSLGIYTFSDGGKYEGEFLDGDYSGQGAYTFPNGDKYVGEYKNGKANGQGTLTYIRSGNKFVGEFKDHKFNGEGILFGPNGSIINQGIWVEGKFTQQKQIQKTEASNNELEKLRAEVVESKKKQEQLESQLQLAQQNVELIKPKYEQADADKRVALVVGNSSYKFSQLDSPINDARMIAASLESLKFEVTLVEDADIKLLKNYVDKFTQSLKNSRATGLFYFAGHGVQNNGKNYILPVDAVVKSAGELESSSFDIQTLLDNFKTANNGMNILILDACRDNPFSKNGLSHGLAAVDGPPGTIVAFSTAPGKVAQENTDNGVYTKRLLENLKLPGASIEEIFKKVRLDVIADTNGEQIPWENTALIRDFYFSGVSYGKKAKSLAVSDATDEFEKIGKNNIYDWINFYRKNNGTSYDQKVLDGVNSILARLSYPAPPLLKEELPYLLNDGYAGFDVASINAYSAEFFKFPKKNGLQVTTIYTNSVAEKSGLLSGDIIFSINDIQVETLNDLASLQPKLVPGEYIEGVVWRDGRKVSLRGVLERASIETLLTTIAYQNFSKKNFQRSKVFAEYLSVMNDPRGLLLNGILLSQGLGVEKNLQIAERDLAKSALKSPVAAAQLAVLYMSPNSGLVNDSQAFKLAKFAADAGRSDGASALALAYFRGIGTSKNDSESLKWTKLSAEMGNGLGMFLLGARYEDGAGGLEKNIDLAKFWYRRAKNINFAPAKSALQRLGD